MRYDSDMTRSMFVLLLVVAVAHGEPANPKLKAHLKAGLDLEAKSQWKEAVVELEAATKEDLDDARAFAELGWAAMQAGDLAKARKADVRAIEIARDDKLKATALFNLGAVEDKAGEKLAAKLSYEASLALNGANAAVKSAVAKLGAVEVAGAPQCFDVLEQLVPPLRGAWIRDGANVVALANELEYCDTPGRVVVAQITSRREVDQKTTKLGGKLVAITRKTGAVASTELAASSQCVDNCSPVGHAGCSETSGCTLSSSIPGAKTFSLFPDSQWVGDAPSAKTPFCGPEMRSGAIVCSTAKHLALVTTRECAADTTGLKIAVYDATVARLDRSEDKKPQLEADGARDFAAATPTYRFGDVTLVVANGAKPTAKLTIGKITEDCFAMVIR